MRAENLPVETIEELDKRFSALMDPSLFVTIGKLVLKSGLEDAEIQSVIYNIIGATLSALEALGLQYDPDTVHAWLESARIRGQSPDERH